jgi:hypothetical protein
MQTKNCAEKTMKTANLVSVALGAGIAVAGVLVLGSLHASATPASGAALIHATQKAEPVASYRIPNYRRCRRADFRINRYGQCVPFSG